jgi:hypothetical protein
MRSTDIANALEARLGTASGLPVVIWENQDALPTTRPYLDFQNVRVSTRDQALAGGAGVSEGYLMITVVADQNAYATGAASIADDVAERYPYGLRLAFDGGHVLITKPPHVMQGFPEGAYWRVPVRIDYQAFGTGPFSNTPDPGPSPSGDQVIYLASAVGGTANAIILTVPGLTLSADAVLVLFDPALNNTGPATVTVGAATVAVIGRQGLPLVADEIVAPSPTLIRISTAGAKIVTG